MENDRLPAETLQRIADGWLAYQRASQVDSQGSIVKAADDDLFDFSMKVDDLVRREPEIAWLVVQLIFVGCRNDIERACLAAGPLEDLLAKHGEAFIDRIEKAASENSDFRELLVGVWRSVIPEPVWERLQRAAGTG
jgi:hypothetical protein